MGAVFQGREVGTTEQVLQRLLTPSTSSITEEGKAGAASGEAAGRRGAPAEGLHPLWEREGGEHQLREERKGRCRSPRRKDSVNGHMGHERVNAQPSDRLRLAVPHSAR